MIAPTLNLGFEDGTDGELRLTWRDKLTQTPIDLTGWSAVLHVSTIPVTDIPVTLGGPAGTIVASFSPLLTAQIEDHRNTFYELDLTDPSGHIMRLVKGRVTVARSMA